MWYFCPFPLTHSPFGMEWCAIIYYFPYTRGYCEFLQSVPKGRSLPSHISDVILKTPRNNDKYKLGAVNRVKTYKMTCQNMPLSSIRPPVVTLLLFTASINLTINYKLEADYILLISTWNIHTFQSTLLPSLTLKLTFLLFTSDAALLIRLVLLNLV